MRRHLFIIAAAAMLSACDKPSAPAAPVAELTPFQLRLDAALQISAGEARDEALGKLARDAAEARDVQVTRAAVQAIGSVEVKDRAAADCSLALAKYSEPKAANEVARMIT